MNDTNLESLAADVRKVWSPPAGRPWSHGEVAILKLLKAIEDGAVPRLQAQARKAMLEAVVRAFESSAAQPTFQPDHRTAAAWAAGEVKREWKLQLQGATWDPRG